MVLEKTAAQGESGQLEALKMGLQERHDTLSRKATEIRGILRRDKSLDGPKRKKLQAELARHNSTLGDLREALGQKLKK
jgi:hypothetical protein